MHTLHLKSMFSLPKFFKTGHRGCRGLYPENTIEGFIASIEQGVNTIELDIVVSKDNLLVVSHEPFMNHEFCLMPDGSEITEEEEKGLNLFKMPYEEIQKFDCGLKTHPRFPQQKKIKTYKPTLLETINTIEEYIKRNALPPILWDIELKSEKPEYGISQPMPEKFGALLIDFIKKNELYDKTIIRSFDPAPLQFLNQVDSTLRLALIVENEHSANENLKRLGFMPFMYSPEYVLLNKKEMQFLKAHSLVVVPWTVNSIDEMREMIALGVDGIITDYPNLFNSLDL